MSAIEVSGAGLSEVNGSYYLNGEHYCMSQGRCEYKIKPGKRENKWLLSKSTNGWSTYSNLYSATRKGDQSFFDMRWEAYGIDSLPPPTLTDAASRSSTRSSPEKRATSVIEVSGAGVSEVNGSYYLNGEHYCMSKGGHDFKIKPGKSKNKWVLSKSVNGWSTYTNLYSATIKGDQSFFEMQWEAHGFDSLPPPTLTDAASRPPPRSSPKSSPTAKPAVSSPPPTLAGAASGSPPRSSPRSPPTEKPAEKKPAKRLPPPAVPNDWTSKSGVNVVAALERVPEMQELVSKTWRAKYTRDRKKAGGKVPSNARVLNVLRIENHDTLAKYQEQQRSLTQLLGPSGCERFPVETDGYVDSAKSDLNEMFLFHGTNPVAADAIARSDFDMERAGSAVGTMFGPGIYLAENASKSDEYATEGSGIYIGICALILCRALAGRVYVTPDKGDYSGQVRSGSFDSVCGDRRAAVGTFREMIFFNEAAVCPAYIILYCRLFEDIPAVPHTPDKLLRIDAGKPTSQYNVGDICETTGYDLVLREHEALDSKHIKTRTQKFPKVEVVEIGVGSTGRRIRIKDKRDRLGWISVTTVKDEVNVLPLAPKLEKASPRETRHDDGKPTSKFNVGDICEVIKTKVGACESEDMDSKFLWAIRFSLAKVEIVEIGVHSSGRHVRIKDEDGELGWTSVCTAEGDELLHRMSK